MKLFKEKIDLMKFIPQYVLVGRNMKRIPLETHDRSNYILAKYRVNRDTEFHKAGIREFSELIPRYIKRNRETFEVFGLLQAEMGKTQNGCLTFCNNEYNIMKKVMKWFEKELELIHKDWKWYIKLNMKEPEDLQYKQQIEEKAINHWTSKININTQTAYPKIVTYISNTANQKLKSCDYGSLIIDYKNNLFSQFVKYYVKMLSSSILNCTEDEIRAFMRGMLAGESCIEIHKESKKFRVHVSASKPEEKELYHKCLLNLKIQSIVYKYDKLVISKKSNNIQLLKQRLMTLSPKKYNKFLRMMSLYQDIQEYGYFTGNKGSYQKISQQKVDKIIKVHNAHPDWPAWKIANEVGVSKIKVIRVRKENDLGKQKPKTPEKIRKQIADFAKANSQIRHVDIANHFGVHESVIRRALRKYGYLIHKNYEFK